MNRPDFLNSPQSWTRATRHESNRVKDACAVEHYRPKSESRISLETWFAIVIGAAILAAIFYPPGA